MRDTVEYTLGRLAAIVSRPLFLFVANNYLPTIAAQDVAAALLITSLAMIATAADPHRRFYTRQFSETPLASGLTFYVYVASHVITAAAGVVFVATLGFQFASAQGTALAAACYFLSEKVSDELLRLRLFERQLGRWGRDLMARSGVQFLGVGVALLVGGSRTPAAVMVLMLSAGNLVIFLPQLPRSAWRLVQFGKLRTFTRLARRGLTALARTWLLWAIALSSAAVGYVDRTVALVIDRPNLPVFMLVVMCFSILQMAVDFFFISRHRPDFLQNRITIRNSMLSREFGACMMFGLLLAAASVLIVLRYARNADQFPLPYVFAIAALQISIAAALIPREIAYWTQVYGRILRVEASFWVLLAATVLVARMLEVGSVQIVAAAAGCGWIRLAMHVSLARHAAQNPQALANGVTRGSVVA